MKRFLRPPLRRPLFVLLFILGITAASVVMIATKPATLGLDLRGGVEVVLEGRPTAQSQVTPEAIDRSIEIIRNRVDRFGVSEPEIQQQGSRRIAVSLPGASDPDGVVNDLIKPAQLFFYDTNKAIVAQDTKLYELARQAAKRPPSGGGAASVYLFDATKPHALRAGPESSRADLLVGFGGKQPTGTRVIRVPAGYTIVTEEVPVDPNRPDSVTRPSYLLLRNTPALTGRDIASATGTVDAGLGGSGEPAVSIQFTDPGKQRFRETTRQVAQAGALAGTNQTFMITLDGQVISTASVDFTRYPAGIDPTNGAIIQGNFTTDTANELAEQINSGAIPIRLEVLSQKEVSATLGASALDQAVWAGLLGLLGVFLFLIFWYRLLGLIAVGAIGVYALLFYGLTVAIPITLTLPGLAGMILTIGVAADANVVIFERVREEVRAGRTGGAAVIAGYRKGLSAILDANIVTLITALVIFLFATGGPKGFAFTLFVGVIMSLLVALVGTRAVFDLTQRSSWLANDRLTGMGRRDVRWKMDFVGKWKMWLSISFVPLLIGSIFIVTQGINFGLDFTSGTRIAAEYTQVPPSEGQVRSALTEAGVGDQIKYQATTDAGTRGIQVQTEALNPTQIAGAKQALSDIGRGFDARSVSVETVGPTFGRDIIINAIWAIALSFLIIIAYLMVRFEWKMAASAMISVVHDVWLVICIYAIVGFEVTSASVAALLTILGYSLYDVVIVFDRIRENTPLLRGATYREIVNRSLHETLTRSIITAGSTLFPVVMLFAFGGPTLRDFSFALMVGLLAGGVSSLVISAPILALWKEREERWTGVVTRRERTATRRARRNPDADIIDVAALERAEEQMTDDAPRRRVDIRGAVTPDAPDVPASAPAAPAPRAPRTGPKKRRPPRNPSARKRR